MNVRSLRGKGCTEMTTSLAQANEKRGSHHYNTTRPFFSTYGKTARPRMAMSKFGNKTIGRPFPVTPGEVSPMRSVPDTIMKPDYALTGIPSEVRDPNEIRIYNEEEIARARKAARLARKMLDFANSLAIQVNDSPLSLSRFSLMTMVMVMVIVIVLTEPSFHTLSNNILTFFSTCVTPTPHLIVIFHYIHLCSLTSTLLKRSIY